jgi:hypothetical protein
MSQTPSLERLKQRAKFGGRRSHFLLIVQKPIRPVVGYGIVVFTDVSQYAQQPVAFDLAGIMERAFPGCLEQCEHRPAVLFDKPLTQAAFRQLVQLGLQVERDVSSGQFIEQVLNFMPGD